MSSDVVKSAVKSVLRPGVELGLDDGSVNIVARLSDIARGEVAGYNASVLGSHRQLFPRLSRKDYMTLSYTDLPDSPVSLKEILQSIPGFRPQDVLEFSTARRLARQVMHDGTYRDIVVPNLTHLATEMDLADYDELDGIELEQIPDLATRARKRTYTLTQVMSDLDVKQKYQLPTRVYVTGERLAATDAPAAAQVFQDAMNAVQDHTRVKVVPGMLAIDNVQASNAIKMMAYGAPAVTASVQCEVVADKIFCYSPEESEVRWHVLGPYRRLADVMEVYRIVMAHGPILPSGLLAVDLVQLKIDIFDGESYMEPVMQFNAAVGGDSLASAGLSDAAAREMTSDQRAALATMTDKLLPIQDRQGRQLATAVRITDRHVLVNDHVHAADSAATIGGRRLSLSGRVARDVWAADCPGSGTPWVYRNPVVGEAAVILYISGGVVSCSSPVVVESVNVDTILTTGSDDVVRGVSGGALVSLKDFALFGIHSASVGASLLNYRFGPEQLEDVVGSDDASSTSRVGEAESFAAVLVKRFSEKGLGSIFRSTSSLVVPLWKGGHHIGMALMDGAKAYTTLTKKGIYTNHDESQYFAFENSCGPLLRAPCPWATSHIPLQRSPKLGEKVFIVGFDDELYVTNQTEVSHVYSGDGGFVLKHIHGLDKPVLGGAVMSWDGAVLGLACPEFSFDTPVGYGLNCKLMFRDPTHAIPNARGVVAAAFPYLHMDLWPDDVLEEVFTHSSAGTYVGSRIFNAGNRPLASIGGAYLEYLNSKVLRDHDIPFADWSELLNSLRSNIAIAQLVQRHNLDSCMVVGSGVRLQIGSKAYANVIEAMIGAAALLETEFVVMKLATDLKLIYDGDNEDDVVNVSEAAVD